MPALDRSLAFLPARHRACQDDVYRGRGGNLSGRFVGSRVVMVHSEAKTKANPAGRYGATVTAQYVDRLSVLYVHAGD